MANSDPIRAARFWAKVDRRGSDDCWPWQGGTNEQGYGNFSVTTETGKHTTVRPHRLSYELLIGPIPDGLVIDHLCRNPGCVNPAHMEPVSSRENTLRGTSPPAVNVKKTHCPKGHPYDEANTCISKSGKKRCRACDAARKRVPS